MPVFAEKWNPAPRAARARVTAGRTFCRSRDQAWPAQLAARHRDGPHARIIMQAAIHDDPKAIPLQGEGGALAVSLFRILDEATSLRLVLDQVPVSDALCVALVCTDFRDAVFERFPRIHQLYDHEGPSREPTGAKRRFMTSVIEDMTCSRSRFAWAASFGAHRAFADCAAGHCQWLRSWGADVARRLAQKGALEALQWARANGLCWDAGACRAAADAVYPHAKMELRRYDEQNPEIIAGFHQPKGSWYLQRVDAEMTDAPKHSPEHMHLLEWLLKQTCEADPERALMCAGCLAAGRRWSVVATATALITDVFDTQHATHRHGQWQLSATDFGDYGEHFDLPRRAFDVDTGAVGQVPTYTDCSNGMQESEIVRLRVTAEMLERIVPQGGDWVPTAENTWFPPYEWTPCSCMACSHIIGWLFTPPPPPPPPPAQQQQQQQQQQHKPQPPLDAEKAVHLEPFFGLRKDALVAEDDDLVPYTDGWGPAGGDLLPLQHLPVEELEHLQQFVEGDSGCRDWAQANHELMLQCRSPVVPDARCLDASFDQDEGSVQLLGWIEDAQRYRVRERGSNAFTAPIHVRPESLRLADGTTVVTVGLLANPMLNGSVGVIKSWKATKCRYEVEIEGRPKPLGLKPANCRVAHLAVLGAADGSSESS